MRVSVIIPVYNVEEYLPRCLKSIEKQTYIDFETILVDDGSTDNSGRICDNYAENHRNTIVIHQENQGLSMARNNAVKVCSGDYVTFIDSDDFVTPVYIEYLIRIIETCNVDVAIGKHLSVWDDNVNSSTIIQDEFRIYNTEEALKALLYEKEFSSIACAKMYKKSLVLNNPYPKGKLYEDMATTYKIIGLCKCVGVGKQIIYFWRQRSNSITNQKLTNRHLDGLNICDDIIAYVKENHPAIIKAAHYKYMAKICMYMPFTMNADEKSKDLFRYLKIKSKPYLKEVICDHNARKDTRIRCICIALGYYPSLIMTKVADRIKPFYAKVKTKKLAKG